MTYALIESNVVTNLINLDSGSTEDFPNAVKVGEFLVAIGDTYKDVILYHNNEPAQTMHQMLAYELYLANETIAELDQALLDTTYQNIIGELE